MTNALARRRNPNSSLVPFRDEFFYPFQQAFDSIFNDFFSESGMSSVRGRFGYPKLDSYVSDGLYVVEVAVPGHTKQDVRVEVSERDGAKLLKISGKMAEDYQNKDETTYYVRELRRSNFERWLTVPENVEGDPDAVVKDGILRLTWKLKKEEVPKLAGREIEVREE